MKQIEFHSQPAELEYVAAKVVAKAFGSDKEFDSSGHLPVVEVPLKKEYQAVIDALKAGISVQLGKPWDKLTQQEIHRFLDHYETLNDRVSLLERRELLSDMLAQELKYHQLPVKQLERYLSDLTEIVADPATFEFITNVIWDHHLDVLRINKDEIHSLYGRFKAFADSLKISPSILATDAPYANHRKDFIQHYEASIHYTPSNVIPLFPKKHPG